MQRRLLGAGLFVLLLCALPALAQQSEALGTVTDADGNPVKGALVKLWAESNPELIFKGKTNKKGRFFVPGLYTGKERDLWRAVVEFDGHVATSCKVENRNAQRVLLGEVRTITLGPDRNLPGIPLRPFGKVTLEFTVVPEDQVRQQMQQAQTAKADTDKKKDSSAGSSGGGNSRNPWVAALTKAQDGDLEGALPDFAKAIEDEPEDAERRSAYANVLYRLERWDEAESQAKKAIELDSASVAHRMQLYTVYVRSENFSAAEATLAEAREIDADNLDVLKQIAFLANRKGDTAEEIATYEKITQLDSKDVDAWANLGDLYGQQGNSAQSEAAYEQVVQLEPQSAHTVFFNLGELMMRESKADKAIGHFNKAIELKPDYAAAHKSLGFALLNVQNFDGAKAALTEYVRLAGDAPDAVQIEQYIKTLQ